MKKYTFPFAQLCFNRGQETPLDENFLTNSDLIGRRAFEAPRSETHLRNKKTLGQKPAAWLAGARANFHLPISRGRSLETIQTFISEGLHAHTPLVQPASLSY